MVNKSPQLGLRTIHGGMMKMMEADSCCIYQGDASLDGLPSVVCGESIEIRLKHDMRQYLRLKIQYIKNCLFSVHRLK